MCGAMFHEAAQLKQQFKVTIVAAHSARTQRNGEVEASFTVNTSSSSH